jgi:flagellar protein FliS
VDLNPYANPYFERKILDADPIDLVRVLHQRAIECVKQAREHLAARRIPERAEAITRAYAVLMELNGALRPEAAPELAGQLQSLYLYVQQRLIDANFQQADAPLADALGVMTTLLQGWDGVAHAAVERQEASAAWHQTQPAMSSGARLMVSA